MSFSDCRLQRIGGKRKQELKRRRWGTREQQKDNVLKGEEERVVFEVSTC